VDGAKGIRWQGGITNADPQFVYKVIVEQVLASHSLGFDLKPELTCVYRSLYTRSSSSRCGSCAVVVERFCAVTVGVAGWGER
jgi:hypothetical protein